MLAWLTTPCRPEARRLGYLREAIALRSRARRCARLWAPHLQQSRAFLLDSAGVGGELGVVLGSGLLLDVPLAELAQRFRRLYLVDMLHLPEVRRLVRAYPGVSLLELDVTGVAPGLHDLLRARRPVACEELDRLFAHAPILPELESADWVASVNLFSQLPLLPLEVAAGLCPLADETVLLAWQGVLLNRHLEWLRERRACLLADARQTLWRPDGRLEVMDYSPWLARLGGPAAAWRWRLADARERGDGSRVEHQIRAWDWCGKG